MTQEKIIRFMKKTGEQIGIVCIPSFDTVQDEFDFYRSYWADEATLKLYDEADYKLEFIKSNPVAVQMELKWLLSETEKLCDSLGFATEEKRIMLMLIQGKMVKEIAICKGVTNSTVTTSISRMNDKAGVMIAPSSLNLAAYFRERIYSWNNIKNLLSFIFHFRTTNI